MRAWQKPKRRGATAESTQTSQTTRSTIVAGILAYNEEQFIAEVVRKARKFVDEVMVVDDGSTDKTARIAKASGAVVIGHKVRRGAGGATKSCFEAAKTRGAAVLVTLDGDGQHEPADIALVLKPVLEGEADVVVGSRFLGGQGSIPLYRKFGIKVITWLVNFGSRVKVSDAQSCFRAYGKKALNSLSVTEEGFGFSVELLVKARQEGCTFAEVPIHCIYHPASHSTNPVIHGFSVAFTVVKLRFRGLWRRLRGVQ
jgi:glycosyltransferase involved in cell wall biosynthesis